jgi:hypothetical protein
MPKIKIIKENNEDDESFEKTVIVPKEKKPRSEKQILAFKTMLENKKKKSLEAIPEPVVVEKKVVSKKVAKPIVAVVEEPEEEYEEEPEEEVKPLKKKRGRPNLTAEKIELKETLREQELKRQLEKLENKIEMTAKKQAKKQVLQKIKTKMDEVDEGDPYSSDTDDEIQKILVKQKKPIVIVNKIENQRRKPRENDIPTAIFV